MKKLSSQRVAVLVDAENLEISAKMNCHRVMDYRAFFEAVNGREVVRAIYFRPRECPPRLKTFLEEGLGVEVKIPAKNCDAWLCLEAVSLAEKVDTVALASGDGDFAPLAWHLKSRGVKVEVWAWPETTAVALREAADEFRPLIPTMLLPHTETQGILPCAIGGRPQIISAYNKKLTDLSRGAAGFLQYQQFQEG